MSSKVFEQELNELIDKRTLLTKVIIQNDLDIARGILSADATKEVKSQVGDQISEINVQINNIRRKIERLKNGESEEKKKLKEIKNFFNNGIDNVDEKLYRNLLDKIVVYPGNVLEIHFTFTKEIEIFYYETKGKMDEYKIDIWKQDYNPYLEGKPPQKDEE